jgi:uncharacterized protein (TIRG00374 family)
MDNKVKIILQTILGLVILALIVHVIGVEDLTQVLLLADLRFIVLAILMYILLNVFAVMRLKYIFKKLDADVKYKELIGPQLGGMLASEITPGRSGYLITPFLFDRKKIPLRKGFSAILGSQIVEFAVKAFGAILALLYLSFIIQMDRVVWGVMITGIVVIACLALLMFLALWSKKAKRAINVFRKFPLIGKLFEKVWDKFEDMQEESEKMKTIIPGILVFLLIGWIIKGLEWWFIGLALGIGEIGLLGFFLLQPLISSLGFVPVTPAGLGIQEGGTIFIMLLLGVAGGITTAFAILIRVVPIVFEILGLPRLVSIGPTVFSILSSKKH